jgi:hypothetical protein
MARSFLQFPTVPYNGQYSSKSFNNGAGQQKGLMVPLSVVWGSYAVNGVPIGVNNPNLAVSFNLNTAGPTSVSGTWTVQSVYIDNEAVNFSVYVYFTDTQFAISCPANSAGWYSVYTNQRSGLVVGLNIDSDVIVNAETTNVFFTDAFMVPSLDQEEPFSVDFGIVSPFISFGGSGGQLNGLAIVSSGSGFSSAGLSVTGAGGTGASADGTLNEFGQFTNVFIETPGEGYMGPPVITPTGAQNLIAPWSETHPGGYNTGALVSFSGFYWEYEGPDATNSTSPPPGNGGEIWGNTGVLVNQPATFSSTVSAISAGSSIVTDDTVAARALGDQVLGFTSVFASAGVFKANLFGTPFASGFIYITSLHVTQLAVTDVNNWQLQSVDGTSVVCQFTTSDANGVLLELQGSQIKLPANIEWVLNCTSAGGSNTISTYFVYTFSQEG